VGPGPINLVFSSSVSEAFSSLRVIEGAVEAGGMWFSRHGAAEYDSALSTGGVDKERLSRNVDTFAELLAREAPQESLAFLLRRETPSSFRHGFGRAFALGVRRSVDLLLQEGSPEGARGLSGCGFGFTPSGDDFLVGHLLALHLLERSGGGDRSRARARILQAARRGEPFADTPLRLAGEGRVSPVERLLISSLVRAGKEDVRRSARQLIAIGSTSGADMGTGLFLTLRSGGAKWS
jgi:hypothetical protein